MLKMCIRDRQELPDSLTQIGDNAFYSCGSLALQELPDGLKQIGDFAFSYCKSLALQELPVGLKQIGDAAFSSCGNLALQTLPEMCIRDRFIVTISINTLIFLILLLLLERIRFKRELPL